MQMSEYTAKYGNAMVKRVNHRCLICQKPILHDPSVIACHTRHRHKLSFEEYFTQYIEDKNSDGTISNQNDSHTSPMNSNSQPVKKNKFIGLLPLATLKNSAEVNSKLSKISQN